MPYVLPGLMALGLVLFLLLARRVARAAAKLRPAPSRAQWSVVAILTLLALAPMVRVLGGRLLARALGPLTIALDIAVAIGAVLAFTTALAGLLLLIGDAVAHAAKAGRQRSENPTGEMGRREFVQRVGSGVALAAGGGVSVWSATGARCDFRLEEVPVRLARLPAAFDGLCIAQLSDVHAGLFLGEDALREAVLLLRRARPDMIVLTGDLVDHDPAYLHHVGRFVRRIVEIEPRFGVSAVLGNHDYYAGADDVLDVLRRAGVRTLRNEGIRIADGRHGLGLAGVDDVSAPRYSPGHAPDLQASLAPLDPEEPRILLAHDPAQFASNAEYIDLQLSGHTHGGQLVGGLPAEILFPHGYIAGPYTRSEAQLYVNRGYGTAGPPLRGLVAPEVSRIILTSG